MQLRKPRALILALGLAVGAVAFGGNAAACSRQKFADNGRYIGGDALTQAAHKADGIQVVKVAAKHLVSRTYTAGRWFLDFGDHELPADYPEYTDQFVFELEPVETLKLSDHASTPFYDVNLRILGFGPAELDRFGPEVLQGELHPNALPQWFLERPANDGYAYSGASEYAGLGSGECHSPYVLEVGQTLVAFRNTNGNLYPISGAFPLEIEVEFGLGGRTERLNAPMQALVPVSGSDDPIVARLRAALSASANR